VVAIGDSEGFAAGEGVTEGVALLLGEAKADGFVVAALVAVVVGVVEVVGGLAVQDTAVIARLKLIVNWQKNEVFIKACLLLKQKTYATSLNRL
jgi:hypothetical protein